MSQYLPKKRVRTGRKLTATQGVVFGGSVDARLRLDAYREAGAKLDYLLKKHDALSKLTSSIERDRSLPTQIKRSSLYHAKNDLKISADGVSEANEEFLAARRRAGASTTR